MAKKKWIQKATAKMEKKGTVGAFGKATAKKIAAGKKAGGLQAKRATFAENMKKIAQKKGHMKNLPGMSVHPVVDCNEHSRRQSQDMGMNRGGEKKNIPSHF